MKKKNDQNDSLDESLCLNAGDLKFIKYFIDSHNKNFNTANFDHAFHDATAIVLYLSDLLENEEKE